MTVPSREPITRVLVIHRTPADFDADLARRFPDIAWRYVTRLAEVAEALAQHRPEAVLSMKNVGFATGEHRLAANFETVRWIQCGGSGYEHLLPIDFSRTVLTNCAGILAPYLAETVIGAMLALNANLIRYHKRQLAHEWRIEPFQPIAGQTLAVIGLGAIGTEVARRARALGMRVLAVRRDADAASGEADEVAELSDLESVLSTADVVSLHVRLTDQTRRLIGAKELAAMKPSALLLNTSRGAVIDEAALVACLKAQRIRGAYLDVFEKEPLDADSPLWDLDNVLLTPHAADNTTDWPRVFATFFGDNLARWNRGERLVNEIAA
ncbi:MAG: D-2-hydroxyacid dehydrogenase [Hyphomicrobiaceae bacterium]